MLTLKLIEIMRLSTNYSKGYYNISVNANMWRKSAVIPDLNRSNTIKATINLASM